MAKVAGVEKEENQVALVTIESAQKTERSMRVTVHENMLKLLA